MAALSGILGQSKYITGNAPCVGDCVVFAVLDLYLNSKLIDDDPLHDLIVKYDNLVSYVNSLQKELYPEDKPSSFKIHQY